MNYHKTGKLYRIDVETSMITPPLTKKLMLTIDLSISIVAPCLER